MALREHKLSMGVLIGGLTLAGAGVAAWVDINRELERAAVVNIEQDARMSRHEEQIHSTLREMRTDVNSIKHYLLERD